MPKKIISGLAAILALTLFSPLSALAFEINPMSNMPVEGDFVLGPGKIELFLDPGETISRDLNITNRNGKPLKVHIEVEDFTGDPDYSVKLLGSEKGPYSLRDYLKPEVTSFTLAHGEKATLPVTVSIPKTVEPGGLFGSVIVTVEPEAENSVGGVDQTKGNVTIVSRLATLFFVRVRGDAKEDGSLKSFTTDKKFYQKPPVNFSVVYENRGNVHLDPYAEIEIKNIFGKKVDSVEIEPYFVMPGFSRERTAAWQRDLAFGRYTATLTLNRGYGNLADEAKSTFWIVPMKVIIIALSAIFIIALLAWLLTSKFELRRKK